MKVIYKFEIGSKYFFKDFDDFNTKDNDVLCIVDHFINTRKPTNVLNFRLKGEDVFFFRNMDKEEFIYDTLESNVPMRAGKFLIPEFCQHIGFTIDDLQRLQGVFENI